MALREAVRSLLRYDRRQGRSQRAFPRGEGQAHPGEHRDFRKKACWLLNRSRPSFLL